MQKLITVLFCLLLLSACNIFAVRSENNTQLDLNVELSEGVYFELLSPASFNNDITLTQSLTINYQEQEFNLLSYLEINKESMTIVGMLPVGTRLFTITYDGVNIKSEGHSETLARIRPEYLLADLQLSLWPMAILQDRLLTLNTCFGNSNCSFFSVSDNNTRHLSIDGNEMISIEGAGDWSLGNEIIYQHHNKSYQINVLIVDVSIE